MHGHPSVVRVEPIHGCNRVRPPVKLPAMCGRSRPCPPSALLIEILPPNHDREGTCGQRSLVTEVRS